MWKEIMKNLIILIVLLATSPLYATTYYVDASGGDDSNNGRSPDLAWQTLDKVNNNVFVPGDSVLFKRGEIWRGILTPQNSGLPDYWVVYSAFGTGFNPQILGSEPITDWVPYSGSIYKITNLNLPPYAGDGLFEFDNYDYAPLRLTEDNAIPSSAGHWYFDENESNGTLYLICSDSSEPSSHNIELCMYEEVIDVDNLAYIEISNLSVKFGNNYNIMIYSSSYINISSVNSSYQGYYGNPNIFSMGSNYVKIEDCIIHDSCNSGIAFYPIGTTRPGHHNTVRGCTISKMETNDGITIHNNGEGNPPGDYYLVENNIISECPEGSIDATGGFHVFRNNICFNNVEDSFQVGGNTNPILIENNICYGNARNGLLSYGAFEQGSAVGNIVRKNVIYDNVKYCLLSGSKHIAIYNNTICNSATRSEVYFEYGPPTGSTYKNNIVYNDQYTSKVRFGAAGLPSDIEMNNNNYRTVNSDSLIFGIAATGQHLTLQQIQDNYSREISSFVINPLFVDVANKDFHLDQNSPCIDAGDFLTRTTSGGTGTEIPLEKIIYFCDGFGIVEGDLIQLEGQTQRVRITSVDAENSSVSVNQSISWSQGDGVALAYSGSAPDIGAFEYYATSGIPASTLNNSLVLFPNPFNPSVAINFSMTEESEVDIEIYDLQGKRVKYLVKNDILAGEQLLIWNGRNEHNKPVSSGIYFVKVSINDEIFLTRKCTLLK